MAPQTLRTFPRTAFRFALIAQVLLLSLASTVLAGENSDATFVLHAKSGLTGTCSASDLPNCLTVRPTVNVEPNGQYRVFFYLNNTAAVSGVQTAFEWDPTWELLGSSWNCQGGQITAAEPDPNTNGGPISGTITTVFDCLTWPGLVLIGYMDFQVGSSGGLFQVNSALGNQMSEVVDCEFQEDLFDVDVDPLRFGRIYVDTGGHDACDPQAQPLPGTIAVNPPLIDFGCVSLGACQEVTVQLSNQVPDHTSVLRVTQITFSGIEFSLADGPDLPVAIFGGTSVPLIIRLCPLTEGPITGTFTVVASNATNSPHQVPLDGVGGGGSSTCLGGLLKHQFVIKFTPGAIVPPTNAEEAPLDAYGFNVPHLQEDLETGGVVWLRKLMPWFTPESIHTTNALGEEVLLEDLSTIYVARVADGRNALDAVHGLEGHPGTLYVEPDCIIGLESTNDDFFGKQWGLHNTQQFPGAAADVDINAPEAWNKGSGSPNAWLAVLDTGVDSTHIDLMPRVRNGPNYITGGQPPADDHAGSHGTAVAGIAGATGNNNEGVVGVSWAPTLVAVKVLDAAGSGTTTGLAAAISWVSTPSRGIHIANMSLSAEERTLSVFEATRNARLAGTLLVAAMGNDNDSDPDYPAAHAQTVLSVGALWLNGNRWRDAEVGGCPSSPYGSNFGPWIDVCAPGGRAIATTRRSNDYYDMNPATPLCLADGFSGTSAATPFVSGLAALLKSYHQLLIGDDFASVILRTADDIEQYGNDFDDFTGYGLIRADAALNFVSAPRRIEQRQVQPAPPPGVVMYYVDLRNYPGRPDGPHLVHRHNMRATFEFQTPFTETPDIWYRASGTVGWRALPFGSPIPIVDYYDEAPSSATFISWNQDGGIAETYVYEIFYRGDFVGWFPTDTDGARIAFTAVGPASPIGVGEQAASIRITRVIATPNPGFGGTDFLLDLPHSGRASLRIYDLGGRLVRALSEGPLPAGSQTMPWDGRNDHGHAVASGVYFWQLDLNGKPVKRDKVVITR